MLARTAGRLAILITGAVAAAGLLVGGYSAAQSSSKHVDPVRKEVRIERLTPEYWRITFDIPPFNIFGPETVRQLSRAITELENDPAVKVVVFDSAVPGFFLTHYDFNPPLSETTKLPPGPTGLPAMPDMMVRISRVPVVSIALIRGRATGVGSELSLASDMRFASREKALLSQWEVGAGLVPGGGPMARLPRLIGRGRALEVLLSGNDIDGALAEQYGYVNRALPDAELDPFVDALARRIAGFDKQTIADIKAMVNASSLPADEVFRGQWDSFITSVQRPQAQRRVQQLMHQGLQENPDVERRLAEYTGRLADPAK